MKRPLHVGVIGAGACDSEIYALAQEVGRKIAEKGWVLICGGLGGVMEAAARGCVEAGGTSVGILPGLKASEANPFIRIPIPTGLGEARNVLVVRASEALVAVSGGYGTLSEIALALKTGKSVIGLKTWPNIEHVQYAETTARAVELVEKALGDIS
ncbi:MAG: TIGR00725 family protein [Deltaproteobacteria bacterium]|nr:MAG: TIGR00725 family protein [Deltaproteobacteria bacterium]